MYGGICMRVLGDIPRLNARRYPNKKALIMGDDHLTFKQLNDKSNQLARGLIHLGVSIGDRVAILAENCLEFAVINYAVAKCGAVLVPINFRYKKTELVYAVNDSEPILMFCGPQFQELIEEARNDFEIPLRLAAISGKNIDSGLTLAGLMNGQPSDEPGIGVDPNSPAVIMYTSGTTGFPKGVLFSHQSYFRIYTGLVIEGDMTSNEMAMVGMPLFHNGGLNGQLQPSLMMGNTCVILGKGFDPDTVLGAVKHYRITMVLWVPTQLAMLVNHPDKGRYDVSTLKKIWYGSSPISPKILAASQEFFDAGFYQWYGQTETGMLTVLKPDDHLTRSHCTGREMFHTEMRFVDKDGNDVSEGEVGEIISIQDPLGMIGYHKKEKATRETIRNGWIYTGDLAKVEGDGFFTIVGRSRDMIISGAENIYPKEIEDVISGHNQVREVAVIGIPDPIWGESVCAVVVPQANHQLTEEGVIEYCAQRVSGYKKPKKIVICEALPKNAAGKVMKHVLRKPFWVGRDKEV